MPGGVAGEQLLLAAPYADVKPNGFFATIFHCPHASTFFPDMTLFCQARERRPWSVEALEDTPDEP